MTRFTVLGVLVWTLVADPALAQPACPVGDVCVASQDVKDMVKALEEQRCLKITQPQFQLDPITVITDKDGRIFVTGSKPHPYTVKMAWCSYSVTAQGQVNVVAAQTVPPSYGFRFRPKATFGFLIADVVTQDPWSKAIDGGLLIEPFFFHWANLNAYVGVRSVGGGFGFDLTKNFGVFAGYAVTWSGWRSNPFASVYFAFW